MMGLNTDMELFLDTLIHKIRRDVHNDFEFGTTTRGERKDEKAIEKEVDRRIVLCAERLAKHLADENRDVIGLLRHDAKIDNYSWE